MNFIKKKIAELTKGIGIFIIGLTCFLVISSSSAFADVFVQGFNNSSGSYVQSHPRSIADGYSEDNWRDGLNDDFHTGENGRKPRSKWEKWGTLW
jgi:hypothetical protein